MRDNRNNRSYQDSYNSERNDENSSGLSELIKKEQDHRHKWQEKYLRSYNFTFRLGQFFGLIYNLVLLGLIYHLIQNGEKDLALKIFALNIAIIAFALLITSIERRVLSKKPLGNRFNNNRNRRPSSRPYENNRPTSRRG
jgi:uncharacterized membrane protein